MGTLAITAPRNRWLTDNFPGERLSVREARLADEADSFDGPATPAHLTAYAESVVRVLGSIYPIARASATLRRRRKVCMSFRFGDDPEMTEAAMRTLLGKWPLDGRTYEGNTLIIVKREDARAWTREAGVYDADEVFADLMEMGF